MNDQSHYGIFLNYFGTHHTFQTFCDKGINKKLIKQLHGTIEEHLKTLTKLNQKGAGIFFCPNETNLKGRTTKHITKVRALQMIFQWQVLLYFNKHYLLNLMQIVRLKTFQE